MPKKPKGDWKANQFDWDRITTLSEVECCFSLTQQEVAIILSYTDMIGWITRWYSETGQAVEFSAIETFKNQLEYKLMSGCCPDEGLLHRYNSDGTYESSSDGGETWYPDPDNDPRNQGALAPPLPGTPSSEMQCAAADNIRDLFTSYRDNLVSLLEAGTVFTAILAFIVGFVGAMAGISGIGVGLSVLMIGLATQLLSLTPESVEEQIDSTALETFKCILFCNMQPNGQLTYANWQDVLEQIGTEFTGFPYTFFYQTVAAMGYIGLSNAGSSGASTADDCGDCDCAFALEPFATFTYANLENRGGGWWRLTADDRADDTWTMYVQRRGGGCFNVVDINVISGTDAPQCTLSNAPAYERGLCSGGSDVVCSPWADSVPGCYSYIGYRALGAFVIDIKVEEC